MATTTTLKTYDDLCRAREDGNRYELIEGVLILVAGPSPRHQEIIYRFGVLLNDVVVRPGRGRVFPAPLDVRFTPENVVQPDLVVVLNDRRHIITESLIEGAPSLLVEIASRSSRSRDRGEKLQLYARFGVPEYWFIDAEARAVTVYAEPSGDRYARVVQAVNVAQSIILPELTVDLGVLFTIPE
jgi:Uma2 family endonuclease